MIEPNSPFAPDHRAVFSQQRRPASAIFTNQPRRLFYGLWHASDRPEVLPAAYRYLDGQLARIGADYRTRLISDCSPSALAGRLMPDGSGRFVAAANDIGLRQGAPVFLTEPLWLQFVTHAATCQAREARTLTAIWRHWTRLQPFVPLYRSRAESLPPVTTEAFSEDRALADSFFALAALQLALARFARAFFPELLGFTLAYCRRPALTDCRFTDACVENEFSAAQFLAARHASVQSQLPVLLDLIDDYLNAFRNRLPSVGRRLQTGFWLYRHGADRCERALSRRPSAGQAMSLLLQGKAAAAAGHHGSIVLGGKKLDEWFRRTPFDGENFLAALRQSPYVNAACPEASRLLALFDFAGPMFGVLNDSEKEVVKAWLNDSKAALAPAAPTEPDLSPPPGGAFGRLRSAMSHARLSNRQLYYHLVNADLFPEVLGAARTKVISTMRLASRFRPPFGRYTHHAFNGYIDRLYAREMNAYRPLNGAPRLSREHYRWAIMQFAPTVLTDGCWLQNSGQVQACGRASSLLERIYYDEIGAGRPEQNHPFIFRQLLESLAIDLPPIHSEAFSGHAGFIAGAFDIPVYLLSIACRTREFFPELLGLNMAIELSGLGRVYLRLSEDLRYWGIDSRIVDLHITIDNMASGHAALARQAIRQYLDDILSRCGEAEMQRHWRRIFAGYRSLHVSGMRFAALLAGHLIKARLQARCRYRGKSSAKRAVDA